MGSDYEDTERRGPRRIAVGIGKDFSTSKTETETAFSSKAPTTFESSFFTPIGLHLTDTQTHTHTQTRTHTHTVARTHTLAHTHAYLPVTPTLFLQPIAVSCHRGDSRGLRAV